MNRLKALILMAAIATCTALSPCAPAQTLQVLTIGSSSQFGPFAVAAYALARADGVTAYHYTIQAGVCPGSSCYAYLNDTRSIEVSGALRTIAPDPGDLWVVWSTNGIWAYLSIDSAAGVRAFDAVPRARLGLAALDELPLSTTSYFPYWPDGTSDTSLTTAVYSAIAGATFTAANSDVRPEDALFATNRMLNSLGYGSVRDPRVGHSGQYLIGNQIESRFSAHEAVPASFALPGGADPFSGETGPASVIIPVGAAPVVFIASTTDGSTVYNASNITTENAALLFSGVGSCAASLVSGATGPIIQGPFSGSPTYPGPTEGQPH